MSLTKSTASYRAEDVERKWYVVDMQGQSVGRVATRIASILRGKHKPTYTSHNDVGDFVVVINASGLTLTGNKMQQKVYRHHTQYPGGLKEVSAVKLLGTYPERIVMSAVRGMLPKNVLGRAQLRKLKVHPGGEHPHAAQNPETLEL